jgi:hypothetical protein
MGNNRGVVVLDPRPSPLDLRTPEPLWGPVERVKARFEARLRRRAAAACNGRHSLASPMLLGHMDATEMWPSG